MNITITIVLIVVFVLMLVMPYFTQKKRNQEYMNMLSNIKVGDMVKTAGGIIGKVNKITDKGEVKTIVLETGSNQHKCMIKFDKQAIYQISEGKKSNRVDPDEVEEVAEPVETVEAVEAEEVVETVEENATSKLNGEEINN